MRKAWQSRETGLKLLLFGLAFLRTFDGRPLADVKRAYAQWHRSFPENVEVNYPDQQP